MNNYRILIKAVGASILGCVSHVHAGNFSYQATDPRVGMNLWQTSTAALSGAGAVDEIQAMHAAGLKHVSLSPIAYVNLYRQNPADPGNPGAAIRDGTGAISLTSPAANYGVMTDTQLIAAIDKARSLGMDVTVNPMVQPHITGLGQNYSRAAISFDPLSSNPAEVARHNQFWTDYRTIYSNWARIARDHGASKFLIGSELESLETDPDQFAQWKQTIDQIDTVLGNTASSPRIGYQSTHWKFDNSTTRTNLWSNSKLDFIALSAYYDYNAPEYFPPPINYFYPGRAGLASPAESSGNLSDSVTFTTLVETHFKAWLTDNVLPLGQSLGKPIVLQEFGIAPFDTASSKPWEYYWPGGAYDPIEAANAVEGVLRSLDQQGASIEQINFWIWQWQGGFTGEPFGLRPGSAIQDSPITSFDESQNQLTSDRISTFINTTEVPEPAILSGGIGITMLALRRKKIVAP